MIYFSCMTAIDKSMDPGQTRNSFSKNRRRHGVVLCAESTFDLVPCVTRFRAGYSNLVPLNAALQDPDYDSYDKLM